MDTNSQSFCGSVFWNNSLTWNTHTAPDFTICFQQTISLLPCAFLLLTLPFYLYYLSNQKCSFKQSLTAFSAAKSVISTVLAVVSLFQLGYYTVVQQASTDVQLPSVTYLSISISFLSMLVAAALIQHYRFRGLFTSGILWVYWCLWVLSSAITFYSQILHMMNDRERANFDILITSGIYFTLCFLQFILSSFSDATAETQQVFTDVCPETLSSFPSSFFYHWITPLMLLGHNKTLEAEDLWGLGPRDVSKVHVPAFEADWNAAVAEWREKKEANECSTFKDFSETSPLIVEPRKSVKEPALSLAKVIFKHHKGSIFEAFAYKFMYDILQFTGPILQNEMTTFISNRNGDIPEVDRPPAWQGYVIALSLIVTQLVVAALLQKAWYLTGRIGCRVRMAIIPVLYKKALCMSEEAKQESTVGEIVNLMAVDAQSLQDFFMYCWMVWSAPLTVGIALWQLYTYVGPSLFVGMACIVIVVPINMYAGMRQKEAQRQQMRFKDERIKVMNEVLTGMKMVKLYAWEPSCEEKVDALRRKELDMIRLSWNYSVVQNFISSSISIIVTVATLAVYVCTEPDNVLSPNVAFVTLSLCSILRIAILKVPPAITSTVRAQVSVNRIVNLFKTSDIADGNITRDYTCDVGLRISDGTFSWLPETQKVLMNINMDVPTGSITAVVGRVGCGKSSLLSACIGGMYKLSGQVVIKGTVAYVAQQAWIQNGTVRENILFGQRYDKKKYDRVVKAVALLKDFAVLHNGDDTLIGEKGINLSGGQKQRVSLARACYSEADLYLLDDPLSAVDANVGRHIFDNVIGPSGLLKEKTRVLVTHGIQWLPTVDNIIVLTNGRISECGKYDDLLSHQGAFDEFVKEFYLTEADDNSVDTGDGVKLKEPVHMLKEICQKLSYSHSMSYHQREACDTISINHIATVQTPEIEAKESVETGKVTATVYKFYAKAMNYTYVGFLLTCLVINVGIMAFTSIWLSRWTDDSKFIPATSGDYTVEQRYHTMQIYLGVYGVLSGLTVLSCLLVSIWVAKCSVEASKFLHQLLMDKIMKAQMMFFDVKPLGQILNRFSKDIDIVDNILGNTLFNLQLHLWTMLSTVLMIFLTAPMLMALILPLAIIYFCIQKFFLKSARQLKRLEAVTNSPIFIHFSETIAGRQTIRAYGAQERFIQENESLVETNVAFSFAGVAAARWLAMAVQVLNSFTVGVIAIFCVLSTQISFLQPMISSSLAGLLISGMLSCTISFTTWIRKASELETYMVSVERIKEYSQVPVEADWTNNDNIPPRNWPTQGSIKFKGYSTRYRPELDLVLKDINITVNPQEKVGVVGRTGAGKSSTALALFRLIEPCAGSIYIDDINIGAIGLHQLRNRITILPQDPVLFSGSMRRNLDPFGHYSDDKLWQVLFQCELKGFVEKQPEQLSFECGGSGENLSVGHRQQVCLARALLRKTKILVLDEATAAVDLETDDLIQKTVCTEFADCTILTIAHRLKTIMDSDRVLVLDNGEVAEFDTPKNLLDDEEGIFYGMAKDAGII